MVYFLGASGFNFAFKSLSYWDRRHFQSRASFFSVKGLSFNPNAINKSKDLNALLKDGCLKNHKNFVILPGVINNTISAHHSNNNTPYPVDDLVNTLKKLKPRIAGIVYCRREGLRDIRAELESIDEKLPIIDVKKHLLSYRKRHNQWIISDVAKLHPSVALHLNMIVTVLKYQHNLRQLVQQTRSKSKNKPSAKQRAKQKRKAQQLLNKLRN